jgi:hypothetical protein
LENDLGEKGVLMFDKEELINARIKKLVKMGKAIKEEGFTPFDFLNWAWLLELESETSSSSNLIDLDVKFVLRKEIIGALKRKAEMLDVSNGTDSHSELVKEKFGVEDRALGEGG